MIYIWNTTISMICYFNTKTDGIINQVGACKPEVSVWFWSGGRNARGPAAPEELVLNIWETMPTWASCKLCAASISGSGLGSLKKTACWKSSSTIFLAILCTVRGDDGDKWWSIEWSAEKLLELVLGLMTGGASVSMSKSQGPPWTTRDVEGW